MDRVPEDLASQPGSACRATEHITSCNHLSDSEGSQFENGPECPACTGRLGPLISGVGKYDYYFCQQCGHVTSLPLPSQQELTSYYDGFLFNQSTDEAIEEKCETILRDVARIVEDIRGVHALSDSPNLLDWGGGTGFYSAAFSRLGFKVTMIDIDPQASEEARRRFTDAFTVIIADPVGHTFQEKFEIVFCNQVIEHSTNPASMLEAVRRWLKPDGLLILTTPNQQCKEFFFRYGWWLTYLRKADANLPLALRRFLRHPWVCCDPPRHLHAFSRTSIQALLRRKGFAPRICFMESSLTQYYSSGRYHPDWQIRRLHSLLRIPLELYTWAGLWVLKTIDRGRRWGNNLVVLASPQDADR